MEDRSTLAQLVVREITGERLSGAEEKQLSSWVNSNPGRARMLAQFRSAQWRMQEWQRYKDVDKQAVWAQMQARVALKPGQPPLPPLKQRDWTGCAGAGNAAGTAAGKPGSALPPARARGNKNRTIKGWIMAAFFSFTTIFC